jgi:hypothetical protein
MKNALTIDVEDYYMVSAFADRIRFEDWPCHESRVARSTASILDILDEFQVAHPAFDAEVTRVFDLRRAVERRAAPGGTATREVQAQIARAKAILD